MTLSNINLENNVSYGMFKIFVILSQWVFQRYCCEDEMACTVEMTVAKFMQHKQQMVMDFYFWTESMLLHFSPSLVTFSYLDFTNTGTRPSVPMDEKIEKLS